MAPTTRNTRRVANAAAERRATQQRMRTGGRPMDPRLPNDPSTNAQLGNRSPFNNRGVTSPVGPPPGQHFKPNPSYYSGMGSGASKRSTPKKRK